MRSINTTIITLLIAGTVIFTGTVVFAAKNYNSSKSNTTTIAIVNQQVGDILLRYGVGGAEINKVTDALVVGVSNVDLKATLIEIGINEEGVQEVFTKLDRLGVGIDEEGLEAAPSSGTGDTPSPATGVIRILTPERKVSTPDTEDTSPSAAEGTIKEILPSKRIKPVSGETKVIDEIRENDKTTQPLPWATAMRPLHTSLQSMGATPDLIVIAFSRILRFMDSISVWNVSRLARSLSIRFSRSSGVADLMFCIMFIAVS